MILQLQIEVPAKNLLIPQRSLARLFFPPVQQMLRHLAAKTGAEADDALGMRSQGFHIDPGLVVLALQMADRHQTHQIPVSGLILREQDQMVDGLILAAAPLAAGACSQIGFTADDRLDAAGLARFIKGDCPVHHSMIRKRKRRHAVFAGPAHKLCNARRPVQ
ncbi:hypothetical protein D3C85_1318980 [compost metagenome]